MSSAALRVRLLLVVGYGAAGLVACGSSDGSDTSQVTNGAAGGQAGASGASGQGGSAASGAAGSSASGASGSAGSQGGSAGSQAGGGSGGASGAGAGGAGAAGAAGGAGSGSNVPCPPAESGPELVCYPGTSVGPNPGCSTDPNDAGEKTIACYIPGDKGAPPSPCLEADEPTLPKFLAQQCSAVSNIAGPPRCRMAKSGNVGGPGTEPAVPRCCYTAQIELLCQARPFLVLGRQRTSALRRRGDWAAIGEAPR